jgi:transcription elongation factor/antiterminator RfaH
MNTTIQSFDDTFWYALYTRPRHEKQVLRQLSENEIEGFLPTIKVRRRWSDRYKTIEEPLFKNYVFLKFKFDLRYHETLRPYGALSFVTFSGVPGQIPAAEVDAIKRLVESELRYDPHPYLKAGRRVRIRSGALAGCEGILTRKKGIARLVLSVNMLQQSVSAEVDAATVEPI